MFTVEDRDLAKSSGYEPLQLNSQEKVSCVIFNKKQLKGPFGDFVLFDVLTFDDTAKTKDEVEKSIQLRSLSADTVLLNKFDSGVIALFKPIELTLSVKKGEKFENDNGRMEVSTYNRWQIKAIKCSDESLEFLKSFIPNQAVSFSVEENHEVPVV